MSTIVAVVLAAGRSERLAGRNKLLADLAGQPVIVRTLSNVLASNVADIVLVTGHQSRTVRDLTRKMPLTVCYNPQFAEGMASSLRAGVATLADGVSGVLVVLGDMPLVSAPTIDRIIASFEADASRSIVVPTFEGQPGHPVLFGQQHFAAIQRLSGDVGGRAIIRQEAAGVAECPVEDDGILLDADDEDALQALRSRFTQ